MERSDEMIPEERAVAVWHRAAQLQAEAAQRLEERSRLLAAKSSTADPSGPGFRRSDVEAAALEAGISPEFVQLALAASGSSATPTAGLTGWQNRAATHLLGTETRSIEVSRTVAASPREVLVAMQRVLPAHPYYLTLQDTVGDDPLNGGILIFEVPDYAYGTGVTTPFAQHVAAIDLKQLNVALRPSAGADPPRCEAVLSSDMQFGVRRNWWAGSALSGASGVGGAFFGIFAGVAGMALTGGLLAVPAALGAVTGGGLGAVGYRAMYKHYLRKTITDREQILRQVDVNARMGGAFAPPQPKPLRSGDDGGATAAIIASM